MTPDSLSMLVNDLAVALGEEWTVSQAPSDGKSGVFKLHHRDGYGVSIREQYPPGRLTLEGLWPTDKQGRLVIDPHAHDKITVAVKRGAAAIAKDIERRLLRSYLPAWQRAQEKGEGQRVKSETGEEHALVERHGEQAKALLERAGLYNRNAGGTYSFEVEAGMLVVHCRGWTLAEPVEGEEEPETGRAGGHAQHRVEFARSKGV